MIWSFWLITLYNNNVFKDLEDRIADLLAEIEKLRRQVEFHKQKEQVCFKNKNKLEYKINNIYIHHGG